MARNKSDIFWDLVVFQLLSLFHFVHSQRFERDCNTLATYPGGATGAVYCTAVCGPGAIASCNGFGICQCNYPCGGTVPNPVFTSALCPPPVGVPPDIPEALPGCMDSCPQVCAGGTGLICSSPGPIDPVPTYLAICSCSCPPVPCNVTTTAAPTVAVALLPNLLTPLKLKYKVIKTKAALLSVGVVLVPLFLKLVGLTLLKLGAALCYWLFMGMEEQVKSLEGWGRSL